MTNPVLGFLRTCALFLSGRVVFDKGVIGKVITMDDGRSFSVFRGVRILKRGAPEAQAYFVVRFKPADMSVERNIGFSRLPMMIFMGFTGFRSKYWAVDQETGLCQGLYEWQRPLDAESYSRSIAMRFMSRRSLPESVAFRIIDKRKDSLDYRIG